MATFTENHFLKGAEFTIDDISIGKPKVNSSGGKNIPIFNAKAKKLLSIATPRMLTWGVNENDYEGNGNKKYDMSFQFPNDEYATEASTKFLENMAGFEAHIRQMAIENSKEWFNKAKMNEDVVDALWTPILKYPKTKEADGSYGDPDLSRPPTLKVKLPFWDNEFTSEIYDMEHNMLFPNADDSSAHPMTLIPKASQTAAIIQCGGIWFAGGKFGVTWKLVQCLVKPKATLKGKCHIQLDDDDMAKLKSQVVDDEVAQEDATAAQDTDDEQDPEPEPEPAPAPSKKKKVVKKKASD
tara:strand:- start:1573 stop:2463 length:891 start_codon:yes stop_codon:yes gene_type:complete